MEKMLIIRVSIVTRSERDLKFGGTKLLCSFVLGNQYK